MRIKLDIDLRDGITPRISKYIVRHPHLIDKALRMSVARYRKKMKTFIQSGSEVANKSTLGYEAQQRVRKNASSGDQARKHIHSSKIALSGKTSKLHGAVRYEQTGKHTYTFGFIGGAEFWINALALGKRVDSKTRQLDDGTVTDEMRDYFKGIGLPLRRGTTKINTPKRPVVEKFWSVRKRSFSRSFNRTFLKLVKEEFGK